MTEQSARKPPGDFVEAWASAWGEIEALAVDLEALQRQKVLDLARRLHPGLTDEDVRNPHDFEKLSDPDWQFEDGVLTGIQTVISAVRARRAEARGRGPTGDDG